MVLVIFCRECGTRIKNNIKKVYCSKKCYKIGNAKKLRKYEEEMRILSAEIGNCVTCHWPKENPKYSSCEKCRSKQRKYHREYISRKKTISL